MAMLPQRILLGFIGGLSLVSACAAGSKNTPDPSSSSGGSGSSTASGDITAASAGSGGDVGLGGGIPSTGAGTGSGNAPCMSGANDDKDGDGWTVAEGDCNDCDPNANPGAIEVVVTTPDMNGQIPPPADEDCDGTADNVAPPCDDSLALDDVDPKDGAKAVGLCQFVQAMPASKKDKKWGVIEAKYVRANGTAFDNPALQVGIQPDLGPNVNVQEGKRMLTMSSGHARTSNEPDVCPDNNCIINAPMQAPPPGFPQTVPGCQQSPLTFDDVGLQVKLRAPTNATGYSFDFDFYSYEFPEYICTYYNDQFVALVDPPPMGSINGNISFDSKKNPVSVNIAFFSVCDPMGIGRFALFCSSPSVCPMAPMPYCPAGPAQLTGSGFDVAVGEDAGATSWLKSQAPVQGGSELTIRFAIWDTGDPGYDSTVAVDNFQWVANGGSVSVSTDPVETPK
jgi:hypothetical protein